MDGKVANLRVCIYALPTCLLMHSRLIELVVRNMPGGFVSFDTCSYFFVSFGTCSYSLFDLHVKYATECSKIAWILLIYKSEKKILTSHKKNFKSLKIVQKNSFDIVIKLTFS